MIDKIYRTFISVPVSKEIMSKKTMLYSTIDSAKGNINWVRNNHLHLTIKYLGNTPESEFEKVIESIESATNHIPAFKLRIEKTGCFPAPERPRVLWMGVRGVLEPLKVLASRIESNMEALGFPVEARSCVPHITVAKISYPQKTTPNVSLFLNSTYDPIDLEVDRVQFLHSETMSSETIYTLIKSFPLGENF